MKDRKKYRERLAQNAMRERRAPTLVRNGMSHSPIAVTNSADPVSVPAEFASVSAPVHRADPTRTTLLRRRFRDYLASRYDTLRAELGRMFAQGGITANSNPEGHNQYTGATAKSEALSKLAKLSKTSVKGHVHSPFVADDPPEAVTDADFSDVAPIKVNLSSGFKTGQAGVESAKVAAFIKDPSLGRDPSDFYGLPKVVQHGGADWIVDGVHRLTADLLSGHSSSLVRYIDLDSKGHRVVANLSGADIDAAAAEAHPSPTKAQAEAGNYRKGHVTVQGLPITIETARGVKRKPHHERPLAAHYGYFKRTESEADGDHVDVFLGPDPESDRVWVIDQYHPQDGDAKTAGVFDEHKVMLGFPDRDAALAAYHDSYPADWTGFGGARELTVEQLKAWLRDGDTSRPILSQKLPETTENAEQERDERGRFKGTVEIEGHLAEVMETPSKTQLDTWVKNSPNNELKGVVVKGKVHVFDATEDGGNTNFYHDDMYKKLGGDETWLGQDSRFLVSRDPKKGPVVHTYGGLSNSHPAVSEWVKREGIAANAAAYQERDAHGRFAATNASAAAFIASKAANKASPAPEALKHAREALTHADAAHKPGADQPAPTLKGFEPSAEERELGMTSITAKDAAEREADLKAKGLLDQETGATQASSRATISHRDAAIEHRVKADESTGDAKRLHEEAADAHEEAADKHAALLPHNIAQAKAEREAGPLNPGLKWVSNASNETTQAAVYQPYTWITFNATGLRKESWIQRADIAGRVGLSVPPPRYRLGTGWMPSRSFVEVPDERQPTDFTCGASATLGVAEYYGLDVGGIDEVADELGTTVEKSTHPSAIVRFFEERGCPVEEFSNMTLDLLRHYTIEQGRPVIVCVQDYMGRRDPKAEFDYGHYLTVIGVDYGYVFAQDSSLENWELVLGGDVKRGEENETNIDAPGRIMVRQEDFLDAWHDVDADGNPYYRWGVAVGPPPGWAKPTENAYNPDQSRDDKGRFGSGDGGGTDDSKSSDKPNAPSPIHQRVMDKLKSYAPKLKTAIKDGVQKALDGLDAESVGGASLILGGVYNKSPAMVAAGAALVFSSVFKYVHQEVFEAALSQHSIPGAAIVAKGIATVAQKGEGVLRKSLGLNEFTENADDSLSAVDKALLDVAVEHATKTLKDLGVEPKTWTRSVLRDLLVKEAKAAQAEGMPTDNFNPDQPRGKSGRWLAGEDGPGHEELGMPNGLHTPAGRDKLISHLKRETGIEFEPHGSTAKGFSSKNDIDLIAKMPTEEEEERASQETHRVKEEIQQRYTRGELSHDQMMSELYGEDPHSEHDPVDEAMGKLGFAPTKMMEFDGARVIRYRNEKTNHTAELWTPDSSIDPGSQGWRSVDLTRNFDPDQPRDEHGRFGSGGATQDKHAGILSRGVDKARSVVAAFGRQYDKVKGKPGIKQVDAGLGFLKKVTKGLHEKLSARYGPRTATVIMASAQGLAWGATGVGALAGIPVWLPGSSIWGSLPAVACAETFLQVHRGLRAAGVVNAANEDLTPDEIHAEAEKLARELVRRFRGWLKENATGPTDNYDADQERDEQGRFGSGGTIKLAHGDIHIHYDTEKTTKDAAEQARKWLDAIPAKELAKSSAKRIEVYENPEDMYARMQEVGIDPELEEHGEVRGCFDFDSKTLYASTWDSQERKSSARTLYHELGHSILGADEDAAEGWAQLHLHRAVTRNQFNEPLYSDSGWDTVSRNARSEASRPDAGTVFGRRDGGRDGGTGGSSFPRVVQSGARSGEGGQDLTLAKHLDPSVHVFRLRIRGLISSALTSPADERAWREYSWGAYQQGSRNAYSDANPSSNGPAPNPESSDVHGTLTQAATNGAKQHWLDLHAAHPASQASGSALGDQVVDELRQLGGDLAHRLVRAYRGAIRRKEAPAVTFAAVKELADQSQRRAVQVADTEATRAVAEGTLDAFERLGVGEVGLDPEWLPRPVSNAAAGSVIPAVGLVNADDPCEACAGLKGLRFTIDQARGTIPIHPNCKCSWRSLKARHAKTGQYVPAVPMTATELERHHRKVQRIKAKLAGNAAEDQSRDEHGRWSTSAAMKAATKIVGKSIVSKLKEHGIRVIDSDREDVKKRGGASYLKYQGVVAISPAATPMNVVHEIGHAIDASLSSDTPVRQRKFDEQAYWSKEGLRDSLKEDLRAATPSRSGPSWENKAYSWEYAFSSSEEAFAHIFASLHGDDTKINGFSLEDVMPKTYAAVVKKLKSEKLTVNAFCPTGEKGGVDPSCSPTHDTSNDKSKFVGEKVGKAEHVHAAKVEQEIAKALPNGKWEEDNAFYDVKSGKDFLEIKCMLKGKKQMINAHPDALLRKVDGMASGEGRGGVYHTVVRDDRDTYEGGAHADKHSGHNLYYKRGNGRYSLSTMQPVKSLAELKRLIKAPDDALPDKAKGELPSDPSEIRALRRAATAAHASRLKKDRNRKARIKSEAATANTETVENAFCPTGPGGGINPTCSPHSSPHVGGGIHRKSRLPVNSVITKRYQGVDYIFHVTPSGLQLMQSGTTWGGHTLPVGAVYKTVAAAARAITGHRTNKGMSFFGIPRSAAQPLPAPVPAPAPTPSPAPSSPTPSMPGAVHAGTGLPVGHSFSKRYKGSRYDVRVTATGIEVTHPSGNVTMHSTLTQAALAIKGTKTANGWKFFQQVKPVTSSASPSSAPSPVSTPAATPAPAASPLHRGANVITGTPAKASDTSRDTVPYKDETNWETGKAQSGQVLNGIPFEKAPPKFWEHTPDVDVKEPPPLKNIDRVGVMIKEPDGRVWIVQPTNHYGNRKYTIPGGTVEKGLTNQQNALKEVWEETGLQVKITGHLGDFTDSNTQRNGRLYVGERIGGAPWDAKIEDGSHGVTIKYEPGKGAHDPAKNGQFAAESSHVTLATPEMASQRLHRMDDLAQLATVNPIKVDVNPTKKLMTTLVDGLQPAAKQYRKEKKAMDQVPGNAELHVVQELRGFNGKPQVVSKTDMDALIARGDHIDMMRGVKDIPGGAKAKDMAEQLKTGDHFPGYGIFGSGTYADAIPGSENKALESYSNYGRGAVIRMALPKTAKIIEQSDLEKSVRGKPNAFTKGGSGAGDDTENWQGVQAALAGYDAIHVDGKSNRHGTYGSKRGGYDKSDFYIILNRSILTVQKENAKDHVIK